MYVHNCLYRLDIQYKWLENSFFPSFLIPLFPSFHLSLYLSICLIKSIFLFRQGLHSIDICGLRCFHCQNSGAGSKEPSCQCRRDLGSIPGLGRSPGEGPGNPLQYSCLETPTNRGARRAAIHGVTKSQTQLSNLHNYSLVT